MADLTVSHDDALKFLETACRNWRNVDIGRDDIADVAGALSSFLRQRATPETPSGGQPVDSGMSGDAVEQAELFWANVPTGRSWTSLATYEKALVCHRLAALRSQGGEGLREYHAVTEQPAIKTERGTWSNHHYTADGLIGERVTVATATHTIVTTTEVFARAALHPTEPEAVSGENGNG